jgi:type IV pilus assembly protein PilB
METAELKKICVRNGMKTLHQDSLVKVKDGLSTLVEALATVPEDL